MDLRQVSGTSIPAQFTGVTSSKTWTTMARAAHGHAATLLELAGLLAGITAGDRVAESTRVLFPPTDACRTRMAWLRCRRSSTVSRKSLITPSNCGRYESAKFGAGHLATYRHNLTPNGGRHSVRLTQTQINLFHDQGYLQVDDALGPQDLDPIIWEYEGIIDREGAQAIRRK